LFILQGTKSASSRSESRSHLELGNQEWVMISNNGKCVVAALASCIALSSPTLTFAMTDAECSSAWTTADKDKDGFLSSEEGSRYHAAARVGGKTIADGKLSQADFLSHCKAGLFSARTNDSGAPLKGANSFTETQAQDRALSYGYSSVAGLKKDGDGIWRGTAKKDDKSVNISVDFKGNVVEN
jgi:hypothetical protein